MRARLDGEITVDTNIALEAAGDLDVANALDFTLDGQVGRNDRLAALGAARCGTSLLRVPRWCAALPAR
jgi:hypothetical protein